MRQQAAIPQANQSKSPTTNYKTLNLLLNYKTISFCLCEADLKWNRLHNVPGIKLTKIIFDVFGIGA